MSRIMRMEENFRLRYKLRAEGAKMFTSELVSVVVQGIEEGVFKSDYPQETTGHAFTIMTMASNASIDILFNSNQFENTANQAWEKISAAQTAIERILGAPTGSLLIASKETFAYWFEE